MWALGQVCRGLKHLHDRSITHSGLKPENVLIFWKPKQIPRTHLGGPELRHVKLAAFGCSSAIGSTAPEVYGTPPWRRAFSHSLVPAH